MRPPIFVRALTDEECTTLRTGLRSWDGVLVRRCQMVLASARGERAPQIAVLVLQQQFMDGPSGVCSAPVWPGLDAAGASATNTAWPPPGRGCVRPSGRRAAAPRGR